MQIWAILIAAAGCQKSMPPPAAPVTKPANVVDCDFAAAAPKIDQAMAASCRDDKWPTAFIACVGEGEDTRTTEGCYSHLSPDQVASFERRIALATVDCGVLRSVIDRMIVAAHEDPRLASLPPESKKMAEETAARMAPKMKQAMEESCRNDKWSPESVVCFDAGKSQADMEACQRLLSPEQKANVEARIRQAMGMSPSTTP
jgi:hypothetical protein